MLVRTFRKRPKTVECVQFDGSEEQAREIEKWSGGQVRFGVGGLEGRAANIMRIHTMEGVMIVGPGDWVIKGTLGEFYPCKPAVHDDVYEEV